MAISSAQRTRLAGRGRRGAPAPAIKSMADKYLALPPRWKTVIRWSAGILVIAAVTLVAYIPALRADFIWDDDWLVTNNPRMHGLDGLRTLWLTLEMPDYLPLTWSSLWLQMQVSGDAWAFHLGNVVLHVAAAAMIWLVLRRLAVPGAWLAGLVFAIHPVNVASVAWVVERKNTLSMVFFLLTVLAYLRYDRCGRWGWWAASLGLFAAALLSKASVVMAPLALLGLIWYRRGRLTRWDLLKVAPLAALSLGAAVLTVYTQTHQVIRKEVVFGPDETLFWRLAGAGWSVWFYIYKALLPVKLAMIYPRWKIDPVNIVHYVPLLGVVGALAALGWYRHRRYVRPAALAMGYFVVMLVPVMGFFQMFYMRFALAADHWQHLSIIGVIALVVGAAWRAVDRLGARAYMPGALLAGLIVAALGVQTWRQCRVYKDQETLWRDNIAKYDGVWMAWFSLGNALQHKNDQTGDPKAMEEAFRCYQKAVDLKKDFHMARSNLGNLLATQGRFPEALMVYTEAMAYKPDEARIHNNRGTMLWQLGRPTEAMHAVELALTYQPDYTPARLNMAEFLGRMGQLDRAIEQLREGIKLDRYDVDLRVKLGAMLMQTRRMDEAIAELSKAIEMKPQHLRAMQNLGVALSEKGRPEEALKIYDRALAVAPSDAPLILNRGYVLQKLRRPAEAAMAYEKALRLNPQMLEALKSLAWLRATHPDPAVRNGRQALELALKLNELTGYSLPDALDVLAAAQAEVGDFAEARKLNQKAVAAANRVNLPQFAGEIAGRDRFYAASQPFRQEIIPDPTATRSAASQPAVPIAPQG